MSDSTPSSDDQVRNASAAAVGYVALTIAKEMIRKEIELERMERNPSLEKINGLKDALLCVQMAENRAA